MNFKALKNFNDRKLEAERIISKYPNQVPIICEKSSSNKELPQMLKFKFLVSKDLTCGQFICVVRNRIKLPSEQALFLFVGSNIPSGNELISELYHKYKDPDGFLYVTYSGENTFGSNF